MPMCHEILELRNSVISGRAPTNYRLVHQAQNREGGAGYAHRFAADAEIMSSVRAMPISYEVISGLPIRPSSLLASYAIGFTYSGMTCMKPRRSLLKRLTSRNVKTPAVRSLTGRRRC